MTLGRSRTLLLCAFGLAVAVSACRNRNQVVVPNRVLDRPLDVALACVRRSGDGVEVLSLNVCDGASVGEEPTGGHAGTRVTEHHRAIAVLSDAARTTLPPSESTGLDVAPDVTINLATAPPATGGTATTASMSRCL